MKIEEINELDDVLVDDVLVDDESVEGVNVIIWLFGDVKTILPFVNVAENPNGLVNTVLDVGDCVNTAVPVPLAWFTWIYLVPSLFFIIVAEAPSGPL